MTLGFPHELAWLGYIIGMEWPEGDEDSMRRIADAWNEAAEQVTQLAPQLESAAKSVQTNLAGATSDALDEVFRQLISGDLSPEKIAEAARAAADMSETSATGIEYTKISFYATLAITAAEIAFAIASAAISFGASLSAIPIAEALAQVAVRIGLRQLLEWIASSVARKAILKVAQAAVTNAALAGLQDAAIQAYQISKGGRKDFDLSQFGKTVELGAAGGAVGGAFGGAAESGLKKLAGRELDNISNLGQRWAAKSLGGAVEGTTNAVGSGIYGNVRYGDPMDPKSIIGGGISGGLTAKPGRGPRTETPGSGATGGTSNRGADSGGGDHGGASDPGSSSNNSSTGGNSPNGQAGSSGEPSRSSATESPTPHAGAQESTSPQNSTPGGGASETVTSDTNAGHDPTSSTSQPDSQHSATSSLSDNNSHGGSSPLTTSDQAAPPTESSPSHQSGSPVESSPSHQTAPPAEAALTAQPAQAPSSGPADTAPQGVTSGNESPIHSVDTGSPSADTATNPTAAQPDHTSTPDPGATQRLVGNGQGPETSSGTSPDGNVSPQAGIPAQSTPMAQSGGDPHSATGDVQPDPATQSPAVAPSAPVASGLAPSAAPPAGQIAPGTVGGSSPGGGSSSGPASSVSPTAHPGHVNDAGSTSPSHSRTEPAGSAQQRTDPPRTEPTSRPAAASSAEPSRSTSGLHTSAGPDAAVRAGDPSTPRPADQVHVKPESSSTAGHTRTAAESPRPGEHVRPGDHSGSETPRRSASPDNHNVRERESGGRHSADDRGSTPVQRDTQVRSDTERADSSDRSTSTAPDRHTDSDSPTSHRSDTTDQADDKRTATEQREGSRQDASRQHSSDEQAEPGKHRAGDDSDTRDLSRSARNESATPPDNEHSSGKDDDSVDSESRRTEHAGPDDVAAFVLPTTEPRGSSMSTQEARTSSASRIDPSGAQQHSGRGPTGDPHDHGAGTTPPHDGGNGSPPVNAHGPRGDIQEKLYRVAAEHGYQRQEIRDLIHRIAEHDAGREHLERFSDGEIRTLVAMADSVPRPDSATDSIRKVLSGPQLDDIIAQVRGHENAFSGRFGPEDFGGCVSVTSDVSAIMSTPAEFIEGLRLDYDPTSPFLRVDSSHPIFLIDGLLHKGGTLKILDEHLLKEFGRRNLYDDTTFTKSYIDEALNYSTSLGDGNAPHTGTGFLGSDRLLSVEYRADGTKYAEGAAFKRIEPDGTETVVAHLKNGKWVAVDGFDVNSLTSEPTGKVWENAAPPQSAAMPDTGGHTHDSLHPADASKTHESADASDADRHDDSNHRADLDASDPTIGNPSSAADPADRTHGTDTDRGVQCGPDTIANLNEFTDKNHDASPVGPTGMTGRELEHRLGGELRSATADTLAERLHQLGDRSAAAVVVEHSPIHVGNFDSLPATRGVGSHAYTAVNDGGTIRYFDGPPEHRVEVSSREVFGGREAWAITLDDSGTAVHPIKSSSSNAISDLQLDRQAGERGPDTRIGGHRPTGDGAGNDGQPPPHRPDDSPDGHPPGDPAGGRHDSGPDEVNAIRSDLPDELIPEVHAAAADVAAAAAAAEPRISEAVVSAVEAADGRMDRFETRLKSLDSLERKIADAVIKGDLTPSAARAEISDSVRYTAVLPFEGYWERGTAIGDELQELGYIRERVARGWAMDRGYAGRNDTFIAPDGTEFEVQFHTEESLAAAEYTHPWYDEIRHADTPPWRAEQLAQMQYEYVNEHVRVPPGTPLIKRR